ncbi:Spy/CpxP family protein refolding chaperone [Kaarinaea lacus]
MTRILLAVTFLVFTTSIQAATASPNTNSPYKGQQIREIKSLSQSDIDGYLSGKGMGFAKAAELNHYPGPRHVLDIADQLQLSEEQQRETEALFKKMQASAIELGEQLVRQEKELDELFAQNSVNKESLQTILEKIGATTAQLRYVHLSTHLDQKQILNRHQVMMYDRLRGYEGNGQQHNHNHSH